MQKVVLDSGIISVRKNKAAERSCPHLFKLGWWKKHSRDQCCIGKEVLFVFLTPNIYDVLQYLYSFVAYKTRS